jgi:hypothetical protein
MRIRIANTADCRGWARDRDTKRTQIGDGWKVNFAAVADRRHRVFAMRKWLILCEVAGNLSDSRRKKKKTI